jgi:hypothetical protein
MNHTISNRHKTNYKSNDNIYNYVFQWNTMWLKISIFPQTAWAAVRHLAEWLILEKCKASITVLSQTNVLRTPKLTVSFMIMMIIMIMCYSVRCYARIRQAVLIFHAVLDHKEEKLTLKPVDMVLHDEMPQLNVTNITQHLHEVKRRNTVLIRHLQRVNK